MKLLPLLLLLCGCSAEVRRVDLDNLPTVAMDTNGIWHIREDRVGPTFEDVSNIVKSTTNYHVWPTFDMLEAMNSNFFKVSAIAAESQQTANDALRLVEEYKRQNAELRRTQPANITNNLYHSDPSPPVYFDTNAPAWLVMPPESFVWFVQRCLESAR